MPSEMKDRTKQLPATIWSQILDQLPRPQLVPFMFVNRSLRSLAINKLYHKATFSSQNSDGLEFAEAIRREYICADVVSGINTAEVSFGTADEAEVILASFTAIKDKLVGLQNILVVCPYFDDAVWAVNILAESYTSVLLEIECNASKNPGKYPEMTGQAKANISRLAVNTINSRILLELPRLQCFSAVALIHDRGLKGRRFPLIDDLDISYVDWATLNFPPSRLLELDLSPNYIYVQRDDEFCYDRVHCFHSQIRIKEPSMEQLKLVGLKSNEKALSDRLDSGATAGVSIIIDCHQLKRLFICNISSQATEGMLTNTTAPRLEFLSLFPVTTPSLRGLLNSQLTLQLILAVVNDSSFSNKSDSEISSLTRWIEDAAAVYPMDLRDFSNSLDREIYFGDGMWCNINQTAFKKFVGFVQP